jgi:hypothetical protein
MDLRQYWRVIKRFKRVVIGGCALAFVLTFLTVARFQTSAPFVTYRQSQTYQATGQLLLSENGCSYYCSSPSSSTPSTDLSQLAILYAQLANSDIVRGRVLRFGAKGSPTYTANAVEDPITSSSLPIIAINGLATSPREATLIAHRASLAFGAYLAAHQITVPDRNRIKLTAITLPNRPFVVKGRKLTVPIVVLLSLLILTFGLAFVLDNLKPEAAGARVRELDPSEPPVREVEPQGNGDGSADEQQKSAAAVSRRGETRKTRV